MIKEFKNNTLEESRIDLSPRYYVNKQNRRTSHHYMQIGEFSLYPEVQSDVYFVVQWMYTHQNIRINIFNNEITNKRYHFLWSQLRLIFLKNISCSRQWINIICLTKSISNRSTGGKSAGSSFLSIIKSSY